MTKKKTAKKPVPKKAEPVEEVISEEIVPVKKQSDQSTDQHRQT